MRRFLPSLSALHAFDASVRHLSFTRAAEDLGITQSGISRQIKNLEDFLGLILFERAGPKLVLTADGSAYYEEISRLLGRLEEVSIDAVRGRTAQSMLKFGLPPTLMRRWGAGVLSAFAKAHREAWFEVYTCAHDLDFATSDLDIAFLRGTGNWRGARSQMLFQERLIVVGAPSIVPHHGLEDETVLLDYPLLQNSGRPSLWLHWLRGAGVHHKRRIFGPRLPTIDMIIECAIDGMGLAIVPEMNVSHELSSGRLCRVFERSQASGEAIYACYPLPKISSPDVRRFREWFTVEFARQRQFQTLADEIDQR